jgi:ABC-type phosphate/phosphonate transport system ATPase subunit
VVVVGKWCLEKQLSRASDISGGAKVRGTVNRLTFERLEILVNDN